MDITGSMKPLINATIAIAKSISEYRYISEVDYVLSTFTEVQSNRGMVASVDVETFDNLTKFTQALESLAGLVGHGGDCHEPTYAGIIKGITEGHPKRGSPMYVFTNALPKPFGEFTKSSAIYHAQRNKMAVNFFLLKPFCALRLRSHYKSIAEATGGFALTFKSAPSMRKLKRMIKCSLGGTSSIASGRVSTKHKYKRQIRNYKKHFVIDDIAQNGTIEIEAKGKQIELLNPKNVQKHPEQVTDDILFWTIVRPMKGEWRFKFDIDFEFEYKVKSQTELDITFEYYFKRGSATLGHPLIGEKAKVEIKIQDISRLSKKSLNLKGWKPVSNEDNCYIYESKKPLTRKTFLLVLSGKTLSQFPFTRKSVAIQPKIADIKSEMFPWIEQDAGKKFNYTASIIYPGPKPKKFRIHIRTTSEDRDNGFDKIIRKGKNPISKILMAPARGDFSVLITIKSGKDEINFVDKRHSK